jgi:hypothetical protein
MKQVRVFEGSFFKGIVLVPHISPETIYYGGSYYFLDPAGDYVYFNPGFIPASYYVTPMDKITQTIKPKISMITNIKINNSIQQIKNDVLKNQNDLLKQNNGMTVIEIADKIKLLERVNHILDSAIEEINEIFE